MGAATALVAMTILSTYVGFAVTIIPRVYTQYISSMLFAIFGLKMFYEGYYMSPDEGQEEYEEVFEKIMRALCRSNLKFRSTRS